MRIYAGIDPGLQGGIVAITEKGQMKSWKMPITKAGIDANGLFKLFGGLKTKAEVIIIIEDVHSIFGVSASANFTFGFVCGAIEAIVIAHELRFIKVAPKTWQKELWISSDIQYKPLKEGKTKASVDTKQTSQLTAKRLFPTFDFRGTERSKKDHDGIIDAALLAEYGRRKNI